MLKSLPALKQLAVAHVFDILECGPRNQFWANGKIVSNCNFQNMPTSTKDYPMAGELRKAILAPKGHVIIAPDSAQIEARVLAWIAGHEDLLERFIAQDKMSLLPKEKRTGGDVYKFMASLIYNVPVEEIDDEQRFIGKIAVLGLGYSMGAKRFQTTLALGVMGPPMILSMVECTKIVKMYRKINKVIVDFWSECETVLEAMCNGQAGTFGNNGLLEYDGTDIWLPNGMGLHYPGLKMTWDAERNRRSGFSYMSAGIKKHIYGGLLAENIVQALAGVVIREEMTEVHDYYAKLKLRKGEVAKIATMTHDEIVSVVPERIAKKCLDANLKIMRTPPAWAPDMPIWAAAEGGWAKNYSV